MSVPGASRAGTDPLDVALAPILGRRWLLVGMGNELRADDAFGPRLARHVGEGGGPALDGGPAPENVLGRILRDAPEVLLLADAAHLGQEVGTVRVLEADAMADHASSTHDPGSGLLLAYLAARAPDLDVYWIAAQPASLALGGPLHPKVQAAVARVAERLLSPRG